MESLVYDLRFAFRMLVRQPGFAIVAVLTLAIGIGATSTIFSFVNGILLRPLPYKESHRLVLVDENSSKRGGSFSVSFPNFLDWREQNHVFSGIVAYDDGGFTLTGTGEAVDLMGGMISYNTFEVLGVAPLLGRTFRPEEDRPDQDLVVILGYRLWTERFGSNREVIGQKLSLNNRSREIIGVMPPDFRFPDTSDLWVPLALDTKRWTRNSHGLAAIARLKPGITIQQARADMTAVAHHIEELNPITNEGMGATLDPLRPGLTSSYQTSLPLLLGVVGMVLLIACANVANLLLARATARRREIAVRAAVGASRTAIFRQLLAESFLLSVIGGIAGLIIAKWGLSMILAAIPVDFPFWMKFNLDWRVVWFTASVAVLTGLLFGTAPALQAARVDLNDALKEGARGSSSGQDRLRSLLVIAEVALSLVLLIGAGLMMKSLLELQNVNLGFTPEQVLTVRVGVPVARYDTPEKRISFFNQFIERIRSVPGVKAAGATSNLPMQGTWGRSLTVEGFPVLSVGQAPMIFHNVITPNYLGAMNVRLVEGRDFTDADTRDSTKVTIVDERLAREYWPRESALGKRVRFGPPEGNEPWHTIVGVAAEVKQEGPDRSTRRSVYLPYPEIPVPGMIFAIRSAQDPGALTASVRSELKKLDADLPLTRIRTMQDVVSRSIWQPRLYAILFGVFAAVALLLAVVGIYGVMSYSVLQRTHDVGIRMAIGAQVSDVLRLILTHGLKLTLIGIAIGLVNAFALTRWMKSMLFGVKPYDPWTFAVIACVLLVVALVACWIPAHRATKVDPLVALRCE